MTEWFWNFKQAALTPRFVIPAKRSAFCAFKPGLILQEADGELQCVNIVARLLNHAGRRGFAWPQASKAGTEAQDAEEERA
jgi:hypothetical protein